jgi:gamma-glutamylputrescine oxidase
MTTVSYWQSTAQANLSYADLPATADVVVIGGGIMGSSAAYYAAKRGLRTVLLDQVALAYGATGRNGGFITQGAADSYISVRKRYGRDATQAIWNYTLRNRGLVKQLIQDEGFDFHYREPGSITFAITLDEVTQLKANIAAYESDGGATGEYSWRDHAETQALIGTQISEEIEGCVFKPNNALIHSARLVYGLGAASAKHGATLSIGKVHTIAREGARFSVQTYTGKVSAASVIVAGNAWSDELLPQLKGVITPVRGQVLTYKPIQRVFNSGMGVAITPTGEYWQQTLDGTILIGGCRADAPDKEWNMREDALRDEVQVPLERVIPRMFPQLNTLEVSQRWSGPMAFTPDYLPVIDAVPGMQGAWVAGGFNGHGMCYGLVTGDTLAEAAASGRHPDALRPFALSRFKA